MIILDKISQKEKMHVHCAFTNLNALVSSKVSFRQAELHNRCGSIKLLQPRFYGELKKYLLICSALSNFLPLCIELLVKLNVLTNTSSP